MRDVNSSRQRFNLGYVRQPREIKVKLSDENANEYGAWLTT